MGEIRLLRFQQEPRHLLQLGSFPDRIPESQLPCRVHGRGAEPQHQRHQQAHHLHGRVQSHGNKRERPRHQRERHVVQRNLRRRHTLRPQRHQGRRVRCGEQNNIGTRRRTVQGHLRLRGTGAFGGPQPPSLRRPDTGRSLRLLPWHKARGPGGRNRKTRRDRK